MGSSAPREGEATAKKLKTNGHWNLLYTQTIYTLVVRRVKAGTFDQN